MAAVSELVAVCAGHGVPWQRSWKFRLHDPSSRWCRTIQSSPSSTDCSDLALPPSRRTILARERAERPEKGATTVVARLGNRAIALAVALPTFNEPGKADGPARIGAYWVSEARCGCPVNWTPLCSGSRPIDGGFKFCSLVKGSPDRFAGARDVNSPSSFSTIALSKTTWRAGAGRYWIIRARMSSNSACSMKLTPQEGTLRSVVTSYSPRQNRLRAPADHPQPADNPPRPRHATHPLVRLLVKTNARRATPNFFHYKSRTRARQYAGTQEIIFCQIDMTIGRLDNPGGAASSAYCAFPARGRPS